MVHVGNNKTNVPISNAADDVQTQVTYIVGQVDE